MDENRPHLDTATLKHGGPKIKSKPSEETEVGEQPPGEQQVDGRTSPPESRRRPGPSGSRRELSPGKTVVPE